MSQESFYSGAEIIYTEQDLFHILHDTSHDTLASKKSRFELDVQLLTNEIKQKKNDLRSLYYLAQSYYNLNDWKNAYKYYKIRGKQRYTRNGNNRRFFFATEENFINV